MQLREQPPIPADLPSLRRPILKWKRSGVPQSRSGQQENRKKIFRCSQESNPVVQTGASQHAG